MPEISYERIREVLDYNPDTGVFRWRVRIAKQINIGAVAGSMDNDAYVCITVDGVRNFAHRLAWLYMNGYFPENSIDHINRITDDNRICNLREVSIQCNARNSKIRCNNTSKVCGVSWINRDRRWQAKIKVNYKYLYIGYFDDFDEAVCARLAAEQCLHWEGCDSSSPAYKYVKKMIGGCK